MNEEEIVKKIASVVINEGQWSGALPASISVWIKALQYLNDLVMKQGWYDPLTSNLKGNYIPVYDCTYGNLGEGNMFLMALVSGDKVKYREGTSVGVMGWKWHEQPSPHWLQYVTIKGSQNKSLHIVGVPGSILRLCCVCPSRKSGEKPRKRKASRLQKPAKRPRASPPPFSSLSTNEKEKWINSKVGALGTPISPSGSLLPDSPTTSGDLLLPSSSLPSSPASIGPLSPTTWPLSPIGPLSPTAPSLLTGPPSPTSLLSPAGLLSPTGPFSPTVPFSPTGSPSHSGPRMPTGPPSPIGSLSPIGPLSPASPYPLSPASPYPLSPIGPPSPTSPLPYIRSVSPVHASSPSNSMSPSSPIIFERPILPISPISSSSGTPIPTSVSSLPLPIGDSSLPTPPLAGEVSSPFAGFLSPLIAGVPSVPPTDYSFAGLLLAPELDLDPETLQLFTESVLTEIATAFA